MEESSLVSEIESTVEGAAAGQKVTLIKLKLGKGVSVSKEEIVRALSGRFPGASIDVQDGGAPGSATVREIEVE
jgi:hypothetical protein